MSWKCRRAPPTRLVGSLGVVGLEVREKAVAEVTMCELEVQARTAHTAHEVFMEV